MFLFNKKLLAVSFASLLIICSACSSNAKNEQSENNKNDNFEISVNNAQLPDVNDDMAPSDEEKIEISIGLVKNSASALGATHLFSNSENNSAYEKYKPVIYNTYTELLNAFKSGELKVAVLPPDKSALAYTDSNCWVTAVTNGCNYYIAENGSTITDIKDLSGKTITVSAEDTMADGIMNIISNANNLNISYSFVDTNAQLISGLKDGSIKLALIQEPYLSQATNNSNIRSAIDLYDHWNDAANTELITSCLVVNKSFVSENPVAFQFFMKDYTASASMAKRNTEETAQSANKFALIDDINASKAAIPGCGLMFKTGEDMKSMLTEFYNIIAQNNADILGGQVPGDDFYFSNEN